MFFKKFFRRDHRYYIDYGEKLLAEGRYADARDAFLDARQQILPDSQEQSSDAKHVSERIALTCNKLAELNIAEAERSIKQNDSAKALEHLALAKELAQDHGLVAQAEKLVSSCRDEVEDTSPSSHSCTGCSGNAVPHHDELSEPSLHDTDRYELLIHALPEDLPRRYAALGDKFAHAFLLSHDGDNDSCLPIFNELLAEEPNDILHYEVALVLHRKGEISKCEDSFKTAIKTNGANPLAHLGLVQLYLETDRYHEALCLLDHMVLSRIMYQQSLLLRAEVRSVLGNTNDALEDYTTVLSFANYARGAAESLVPLLRKLGRDGEADAVAKRYLKGCC